VLAAAACAAVVPLVLCAVMQVADAELQPTRSCMCMLADFYNVPADDPMVHCARFFYGELQQKLCCLPADHTGLIPGMRLPPASSTQEILSCNPMRLIAAAAGPMLQGKDGLGCAPCCGTGGQPAACIAEAAASAGRATALTTGQPATKTSMCSEPVGLLAAGVVFRRDVLVSIGGQAYGSVTEDYNTAMCLMASGFSTM